MDVLFGHVPQPERHGRHVEHLLQAVLHGIRQRVRIGFGQQPQLPVVQALLGAVVVVAMAHQVGQAQLQALVLLAQDFHLALLQRHGAVAVRAGQLHGSQQLGVLFEEFGMALQVGGDVLGVHGAWTGRGKLGGSLANPLAVLPSRPN
ncbi:hypothetical protein D9M68_832580 [compost metagenome]